MKGIVLPLNGNGCTNSDDISDSMASILSAVTRGRRVGESFLTGALLLPEEEVAPPLPEEGALFFFPNNEKIPTCFLIRNDPVSGT
ncbi:hypothetical protein [uncultured Oxalicibacterium sp.]|uniref:hypothetical protein n=1 Tax=uncultured Oxalicibacterium sp. TaxID=1168540 RepID=UPI0025DA3671|nr:hypothetical protein [uncultured Oxalicibacterium sp.]